MSRGARLAARGLGAPPTCRPARACRSASLTEASGIAALAPRRAGAVGRLPARAAAAPSWRADRESSSARGRRLDRLLARDPRCRAAGRLADRAVWRVSVAPSRGAGAGRGDRAQRSTRSGFSIGAAGSLWASPSPRAAEDGGAAADPRGDPRADGHGGGHATLIKAPAALRRAVPVFEPQPPGLAALVARGSRTASTRAISQPRPHGRGELSPCRPISRAEQLADPDTAQSEKILRTCTHCGFCTATCPTYVLLGDELDGPRGRIYLIKDMLERGAAAPAAETVKHIDRCLSCLACMTTCPSGVNYMHLVDHARRRIEEKYRRPLGRARLAPAARHGADPAVAVPPGAAPAPCSPGRSRDFCRARLAPLLALAPASVPAASPADRPQVFPGRKASGGCASRCSPAARSGCWRPRSTRRRSGC